MPEWVELDFRLPCDIFSSVPVVQSHNHCLMPIPVPSAALTTAALLGALWLAACSATAIVASPSLVPEPLFSTGTTVQALPSPESLPAPERIPVSELQELDVPIIMFHYVEPAPADPESMRAQLGVTPEELESQVRALSEAGFTFYTVSEVPALMAGRRVPAQKRVVLTFDDGYEDFYLTVLPILERYRAKATLYVVTDFLNTPGYLSTEQLLAVAASDRVEIGNHTATHRDLQTLNQEEQRVEIVESKVVLERLIGRPVLSFAYPIGHFDDTSVAIAAETYVASVAIRGGRTQRPADIQTLKRLRIASLRGASLRLFLEGS